MLKLYRVSIDKYEKDEERDKLYSLLNEKEQKIVNSIKNEYVKLTKLTSIAVTKLIASLHLNINARDTRVIYDDMGKPHIDNSPYFFHSVSHTEKILLILVSDSPCGVDVESIDRKIDLQTLKTIISKRTPFDTDREFDLKTFLELYTKAEAFFKMTGRELKECKAEEILSNTKTVCQDKFMVSVCSNNILEEIEIVDF